MQVKFSLLYGSTIPLLCLLQFLSLPPFLSKHEKNVIFESSVYNFSNFFQILKFIFMNTRLCLMESHHKVFVYFTFLNKIRQGV